MSIGGCHLSQRLHVCACTYSTGLDLRTHLLACTQFWLPSLPGLPVDLCYSMQAWKFMAAVCTCIRLLHALAQAATLQTGVKRDYIHDTFTVFRCRPNSGTAVPCLPHGYRRWCCWSTSRRPHPFLRIPVQHNRLELPSSVVLQLHRLVGLVRFSHAYLMSITRGACLQV